MKELFRRIASTASAAAGRASTFLLAVVVVVIWALSGHYFNYSDTWQLVINTGTTIVTFLMVFLIQNTQNRDGKAVQIKLDELIRATAKANDSYISIEDLSDEELTELNKRFTRLKEKEADPVFDKLHQKVTHVLNKRLISLPGEATVAKLIAFNDHTKKSDRK